MPSLYDKIKVLSMYDTYASTTLSTGTSTSSWRALDKNFNTICVVGTRTEAAAAADLLDLFKVQVATDSSGTGAVDVTNAALTTFTSTGVVGVNVAVEFDMTAVKMLEDANSANYTHFAVLQSLVADAGSNTNVCVAIFHSNRYKGQHNMTSYARVG